MFTKNQVKILIFVLISALILVGCGGNQATPKADQKYVIKMASPSNPQDSCVQGFYKFKEIVEAKSDGRIEVEVFHSGQLGAHRDYIEGLQMGTIQIGEINTSVLSAIDDKFMIFDLPYIAKSMDHEVSVIKDGVGEMLSQRLEEKAGIKIIGWMVRGPRSVYSNRGPIHTAEDFNGLSIRVMQSPVMIRTMELLGAKPVPIAATERYMALQTGVVDAAENSVPLIITEKEYEVTKFVSLTEHFITPNVIAMDAKFFNNLPEDLQKIVLDAGEQAGDYVLEVEKAQIEVAVKELEERGMKINTVEDKTTFIEKVTPLYEQYQDSIGKDLIDLFVNTN